MDIADARQTLLDLNAAMTRRDRAAVNRICLELVEQRAPLGRQWRSIAMVLQHNGELNLAERALATWSGERGDDREVRFLQASMLAQRGKLTEAASLLKTLDDGFPDPLANAFMRGTIATNLGRFAEGRSHLRRAVAAQPSSGQSWLALAMAGAIEESDAAALEGAAGALSGAPAIERSAYHYALGKLHHEREEWPEAFRAFELGAREIGRERRYDETLDRADAEAAVAGWDRAAIASLGATAADTGPQPIFIAGLPRSGTTLVEQILVSHSRIGGGEEVGLMRILEQDIGGKSFGDFQRFRYRGGDATALANLYRRLLDERISGAEFAVDKTLSASRYMGLILALFPESPIIWMRRDPLDCAWSAFRTWFLKGLSWSWSLDTIATHFKIEDGLFAHWTALVPDRICIVDYARLVSDPGSEIPRIMDHCRLDSEQQQLRPHETPRSVVTSSVAQVRAPINRGAVGAAQPYRQWLRPFIDAYRN